MVILSKLSIDNNTTLITVKENGTIYGNNFIVSSTIQCGDKWWDNSNLCNRSDEKKVISLDNGNIENLILTGPIFTSYLNDGPMNENPHGVVSIGGTNTIKNSYLFGFVSPVGMWAGTLNVEDSVIEGGSLANVYFKPSANATLNMVDSVTIQNRNGYLNGSTTVYGMGIFTDTLAKATINMSGTSYQYNFIDKDASGSFSGEAKTVIEKLFGDKGGLVSDGKFDYPKVTKPAKHTYSNIQYINMGIIHEHRDCGGDSAACYVAVTDADYNGFGYNNVPVAIKPGGINALILNYEVNSYHVDHSTCGSNGACSGHANANLFFPYGLGKTDKTDVNTYIDSIKEKNN